MEPVFFKQPLQHALFLKRLNRFSVLVQLPRGEQQVFYLPNSGRLAELLTPGADVIVSEEYSFNRKTKGDLLLVRDNSSKKWVCVDSRLPLKLLNKNLAAQAEIIPFPNWEILKREPRFHRGRFDFLLGKGSERCFIEAKSVTLVKNGAALFPDAPTSRGQRHLKELASIRENGYRCAVIFIIQRDDAFCFTPNSKMDPLFANYLDEAVSRNVEVYAYRCQVSPSRVVLASPLPVSTQF